MTDDQAAAEVEGGEDKSLSREESLDFVRHCIVRADALTATRQRMSSAWAATCTGAAALIGSLASLTDAAAAIVPIALSAAAVAAMWTSASRQYRAAIGWWYSRARRFELRLPIEWRVVTEEFDDLYRSSAGNSWGETVVAAMFCVAFVAAAVVAAAIAL